MINFRQLKPWLFFIIIFMIVSIACGSTDTSTTESSKTGEQGQVEQPSTPKLTSTPKQTNVPTSTPNPNLIKQGTHLIGTEMKPGLYQGQEEGCYWERLKDLSGSFSGIIANGNSNGQFYVFVKETDMAFNSSCSIALLDPLPEHTGEYPNNINPGMYLIGLDIKPGIYTGQESGCYWERLKDAAGDFDGIISNANTNGQFYLRVEENDFAFSTSCNVTFLDSIEKQPSTYPQKLSPGMYLVGYDIQPGTYKGIEEGCYWERLSDITGEFSSIISNDNSNGQFYIQVSDSDFAISTSCVIERVND